MRIEHTYCRICEPACALKAEVDDANRIRLMPDKDHPVHQGFACHKGLKFVEVHEDPDRLNHPLRRVSEKSQLPQFERCSWDEAAQDIAARLQTIRQKWGPQAVGSYIGNPSAFNSSARLAARQFIGGLEMSYIFGSGTQDCTNKFAASEAVYGTVNLHPIPDFEHTRFLLSIGSNPRVSHMSFVHTTDPMGALRGIVKRGGRVVHVNPRRIESVSPATGEWLQIAPDTDLYLLAALIHTIFDEQLDKPSHYAPRATNIDALKQFVSRYPAERVAGITGIPTEDIRALARTFAGAEGASIHVSTGVNMGRQGTLAYWLVQMLSLVTGNLGARGGNIYSPGYFPAATVGKPKHADPFFDSPFGPLRRITGNLPANLLPDYIERGDVKALVCMSGNPLLSVGGSERFLRAFSKLELLIVIDIYPSATAQIADYALPACDWLERADVNAVALGFQPQPYVQYTPAVVPPAFERKPEWWIFARIQHALGLPNVLSSETYDPLGKIDAQLQRAGLSIEQLKATPGHTVTLPEPTPGLLFELGVQHADKRIDCCPSLFAGALERAEAIFLELQAEPATQLKLISLRTNYMVNSWFNNLPSLKRDNALNNPLMMHPADAERLDLRQDEEVRVSNAHGALIATVCIDDRLRKGVVAMTHGYGHGANPMLTVASNHPGVNVNSLLPSGPGSFEPLSNQAHMTGIPVTVQRAN